MKHKKEMNGKSVDIYSCYEYDKSLVRDVCHDIKDGKLLSIKFAATKMSETLLNEIDKRCCVLVPIPQRFGFAMSNLILCEEISKITSIPVCNILNGRERESVCFLKKNKPEYEFKKEFFGFYIKRNIKRNIILVDNVIDTGITCTFASELFERVSVLTFAHTKKTFECG